MGWMSARRIGKYLKMSAQQVNEELKDRGFLEESLAPTRSQSGERNTVRITNTTTVMAAPLTANGPPAVGPQK